VVELNGIERFWIDGEAEEVPKMPGADAANGVGTR
jgi:hypothetical protein